MKFTRCLAGAVWYSFAKENNKNHELKKKGGERKIFILIKSGNVLCTSMVLRNPTWFSFLGGTM